MPKGIGSVTDVIGLACVCLALACARTPWPDEAGIPVDLVQAENLEAGDAFMAALTARRRSANLLAPIVAARYQPEIRVLAGDLQAGKTSVALAQRALAEWAQAASGRGTTTFAIDCSKGERMELPSGLVEVPTAVIAYAAAHFRPRSLPRNQCVILVVTLTTMESVEQTKMSPP